MEKYSHGDRLRPGKYADLKNVHPSRITALKSKLKTETAFGVLFIVHCKENDKLFDNPSHNSKRKGGES